MIDIKIPNILSEFRNSKRRIIKACMYLMVVMGICMCVFLVYYDNWTRSTTSTISDDASVELVDGVVLIQQFSLEQGSLEYIKVHVGTNDRVNHSCLYVTLYSGETIIQQWEVECIQLEDDAYYTFMLDNSIEWEYAQDLTMEFFSDAGSDNSIVLYTNTSGEYLGLSIDGKEQSGESICFVLGYKISLSASIIPYIKRLAVIVCILVLAWFVLMLKGQIRVENSFLVLWIPITLMMACSGTIFSVSDESDHFHRALAISEGYFITEYNEEENTAGQYLPLEDRDIWYLERNWVFFDEYKDMEFNGSVYVSFFNTAAYAPVSYLPQAIGIFLARLFTSNIAAIAYAGRFANWLCITVLLYLAIRILPRGKEFLALIALIPMNVQESFSLAPDGMVVAIAAVILSFVMYLRYEQKKTLSGWQIVALYVLAILISLYKIVYLPFCLLYFLIPKERFRKGQKRKILHAVVLCILVLGCGLGWLSIAGEYLVKDGTDGTLQLLYIFEHPLRYILTVCRTFMNSGLDLFERLFGTYLGWSNVSTVRLVIVSYAVPMILSLSEDYSRYYRVDTGSALELKEKRRKRLFERLCLGIIIIVIFVLIATSLYLQWTNVYANTISGLQGRYYIPLMLPFYLLVVKKTYMEEGERKEYLRSFSMAGIVLTNVCACISYLFACFGNVNPF